ncbi:hypothetical protein LAZ67_15003103 [Cordylochernes scorpioides]|uniref:Protein sleepless n=1 Tax=Cordylochernes scorpioides TaxID=51811 RepID=A0ABY6LCN6_9ARAC|nr:hypothetical protein LAZ67_15003103 [Cordylochernes scorpioides]
MGSGAIRCYRCASVTDPHCTERFDPLSVRHLQPEDCNDVFEARYCVKTTGIFQGTGVIGTSRFCSSRHHGNYCEYVRRPGDPREYRSCVYTCNRDGCNSALRSEGVTASLLSVALAIVLAI